jgi:peptidoglycan/xylan/chitin deacetylase (PgdA/CDA1 family)
MLRGLKQAGLVTAQRYGLFKVVSSSRFRNSKVLILGYHGVSLKDEHQWNPFAYVSPQTLRQRLEIIKRNKCTVLSLEEAIQHLKHGHLPERSVVLTFDDGTHDFYSIVLPMLQEFGYPATVYLTTYYVENPFPSTPGIWSYLLWKARNVKVNARKLLDSDVTFDLSSDAGRATAVQQIRSRALSQNLDARGREALSQRLAQLLGIDYQQVLDEKVLQLMRPSEIQAVARAGASVQMHMHVHVTPSECRAYIDNLEENRRFIVNLTRSTPHHFCYPGGVYDQQSVRWLRDHGIESATTCNPGLTTVKTDRLQIPRLMDCSAISEMVFESWIVGLGPLIYGHPQRPMHA